MLRALIRYMLAGTLVATAAMTAYRLQVDGSFSRLDFSSTTPGGFSSFADLNAQLRGSIQAVERGTRTVPGIINNGPTPAASNGCPQCVVQGPTIASARFDQCTTRDNYMEAELLRMRNGTNLASDLIRNGLRSDSRIPYACVNAVMSRVGTSWRTFGYCAGNGLARKTHTRPCLSQNYMTLAHNSLDLVTRCMADYLSPDVAAQRADLRLMLGMFVQESGMHVNILGPALDGGVGQFTPAGIQGMNNGEINRVRNHLNAKGGACLRMSNEVLSGRPPMRSENANSCDRISLHRGNPMLNMIYTFGALALNKRSFRGSYTGNRLYSRYFVGLSAADISRIETAATIWSHNTGIGGLNVPLTALLHSPKYAGKRVTNVDEFIRDLSQAMRTHPHPHNSGATRRHVTATYFPSILGHIQRVETHAGGGSCVRN